MTQTEMIEQHLKTGQSLTFMDALVMFGCSNLKGRVWDLKQKGLNIDGKFIKLSNGKHVKKYFLGSNNG